MRKVAAYSILEVIIVMLISGIILSLGYTALEFISNQQISFIRKQDEITDKYQLIQFTQEKVRTADQVYRTERGLKFVTDNEIEKINFSDSTIISNAKGEVILSVKSNLETTHFQGQIVTDTLQIIDYIELGFESKKIKTTTSLFKRYDVATLLANERN